MKGLLITLFAWSFFVVRVGKAYPVLNDLCYSLTALLVAFILIKHFDHAAWTLTMLMVLPDFFIDIILLITPLEPHFNLISILCTISVLVGTFISKFPLLWKY